jgi:hypothetical protein
VKGGIGIHFDLLPYLRNFAMIAMLVSKYAQCSAVIGMTLFANSQKYVPVGMLGSKSDRSRIAQV